MKKLLSTLLAAFLTTTQLCTAAVHVYAEEELPEETDAVEVEETAEDAVVEEAAVMAEVPAEAVVDTHTVSGGKWRQSSSGWWYQTSDGGYLKNGAYTINGDIYRFNNQGYMITGWAQDNGSWCYMNTDGRQVNFGWKQISGTWYYFRDGRMLTNAWVDSYYLKSSGAMAKGWIQLNENWYFFNSSGVLKKGWLKVNNQWYYLDPSNSGTMVSGQFLEDGGKTYYLKNSGVMAVGWLSAGGNWYYFGSDGARKTGWLYSNSKYYYLDPSDNGSMVSGERRTIGNAEYLFNTDGSMFKGWKKRDSLWYFYGTDGALCHGWKSISGLWYYFDDNGVMLTGDQEINGKKYHFNDSGVWTDDVMSIAQKFVGKTGTCVYIAWLATYEITGMHGMVDSFSNATVEVPASQAKPGDIVYYGNGAHVATYLGNGKCLSGNTGVRGATPCAIIWNVSDSSHYYKGVRYMRVIKDVKGTWNASGTQFYRA